MKETAALGEGVRFLGFVEDADIPALVSMSSMIVLPYTGITQSGVLHWEVIPYTKPVIATDVGGIGETVRKHGLGAVIPPGDSDALAHAVLDLLNDKGRREIYAANARNLKGIYAWEYVASGHAAIYQELLDPSPGRY
jgi:glycosyltransferase involved in cell wall biosynthesis